MYGWEIRMLLKHYLDQGVSKTDLSRRFGINPRTIHYWIKTGQLNRDLSTGARGTRRDRPLWITASGEWINDRTHGQQFKARFMRTSEPSSIEGIEKTCRAYWRPTTS